ncbi:TPA: hypothetical protein ROV56_002707 [Staphylococcus aureus]|nr:trypsin-like peptidase domain-containing protein [Staphylococcus aureus]HDX9031021.1 hypothetical protein [Staphylococcus aureus]
MFISEIIHPLHLIFVDYYTIFLTLQQNHIGSVYPGQSGISTPYGNMNISTYIPNNGSEDIAIIKGKEDDKSEAYKHYIKGFHIDVKGRSEEELKALVGQEVYSYGYPSERIGAPMVKSEGKILSMNPVTRAFTTSIHSIEGQSGSGVFLKEGDQFLGVLYGKTLDGKGQVAPIDERLKKWIDKNS